MSKKWLFGVLGSTSAMALAVFFVAVVIGLPARSLRATPAPSGPGLPPASADQLAAPLERSALKDALTGDGLTQGIKVHGYWTIEVREPDGRLVDRREFENALSSAGATNLPQFFHREWTLGTWTVVPNPSSFDLCRLGSSAVQCLISEPMENAPSHIQTLTATVPSSGPNVNKLVLSGTAIAAQDADITTVATRMNACSATVAPASCGPTNINTFGYGFTTATVSPAVPVATDQQILVTVVISFS